MAEAVKFESREQKLNQQIETEVATIRSSGGTKLPGIDAPIVRHFVQKIEGTYDVERAKTDTDNAIDLLYIAYNTTPQEEGSIRVQISAIMDKLIKSQQSSELTMKTAIRTAKNILDTLDRIYPDWLDVKEANDPKEIKDFVSKDLIDLAKEIKEEALSVRNDLQEIANTYDAIIKDTAAATKDSEQALSARLKQKAAVENEINEANAKREQLESLVKDLQEEVAKFEKMARDFEARAETAESRAFVMSIIRAGAQMISGAIPSIAMAAGGAASFLAASTLGTLGGASGEKKEGGGKDGGGKDGDSTAQVIQTKKQISDKQADLKAAETKREELKTKIKGLEAEKTKLLAAKDEGQGKSDSGAKAEGAKPEAAKAEDAKPEPAGGAGKPPAEASTPKKDAVSGKSAEVAALDQRIADAKADLKTEEDKCSDIGAALAGLQASLKALDQNLGKLSDEQQQQAGSLRKMQMEMLDKVEAYEREKRGQAAELVKINALLKGKRTEEETIQLAIKSLNLSLSALKRTKEIVEEIAFFFKSFADFMDLVANEATLQLKTFESAAATETLRKNRLAQLVESTDAFFIKQAGEWHAVTIVSDKFTRNFANGWSKLNKLSGTYIKGDELAAYLATASAKLTAIVDERQAAADRKIADLDGYREQLRASVAA